MAYSTLGNMKWVFLLSLFSLEAEVCRVVGVGAATDAGDYFVSGFLCGILNDYSLEKCARPGNLMGGAIVELIGAQLPEERWNELRSQ